MVVKIRKTGAFWGIDRYSGAAAGDVVAVDKALASAVGDKPLGLLLDDLPTDNPPEMLTVYGQGTLFLDTVIDGVANGTLVYSDGDGTYSTTEPAGAAGTLVWILGVVREFDTEAANTGAVIEVDIDAYEKGA